jgi:DNA-binding NarL/FixJ family response regulator
MITRTSATAASSRSAGTWLYLWTPAPPIDGVGGYRCVGRFGSVENAFGAPRDRAPQVLLLDVKLPGSSGAEGVRELRRRFPSTEILLTVYVEEDEVLESICHGAVGYLLEQSPSHLVLEAIREAASCGAPMSPEIGREVAQQFRRAPADEFGDERLTLQETRLLQLLADGHSYQSAGDRMEISVNTVRGYVRIAYDKLQVHSKSEAVSKALRRGLIT